MFSLKFRPQFSKQSRDFLAERTLPPVEIPASLELSHYDQSETRALTARQLWKLCFSLNRPLLVKSILESALSAVAAMAATLISLRIFAGNSHGSFALLMIAFAYLIFTSLSLIGNTLNNRTRTLFSLSAEAFLTSQIANKLTRISPQSLSEQSVGNLKVLITSDVKAISEFLNNFIRNLVPSLVSILLMAPALVFLSGFAGLLGLFVLFLIIPIALIIVSITRRIQHTLQTRSDDLTSLFGEWIKNVRLIRFLSWDEAIEKRIAQKFRSLLKAATLKHVYICLLFGVSTTWWMVTGTSVITAARLFEHQLSLSGFFGSLWLLTFIAGYFTHIPNTIGLLGSALPAMKRIEKLLECAEWEDCFEIKSLDLIDSVVPLSMRVSLPDTPSIEINFAEKTAILGEVGSGKTTFLKTVLGDRASDLRFVEIKMSDGAWYPLTNLKVFQKLRTTYAYVPQNPYVSSESIQTNVDLWDETSTDTDFLTALQFAELDADLSRMPEKAATRVGESGVALSGGQRQRLNLARAFYSRRPYLILDDTLSALDGPTEAKLMERLCSREIKGFLLVTHRLSEIMRVDRVLVMKDLKIIEDGKPFELLKKRIHFLMLH